MLVTHGSPWPIAAQYCEVHADHSMIMRLANARYSAADSGNPSK